MPPGASPCRRSATVMCTRRRAASRRSGPAVRGATTVEAVAAAVRGWADRHPEAEWVGRRLLRPRAGTRRAVRRPLAGRRRAPTAPSSCRAADYHTVWCNAEALRRAGVDAATPDPPVGWIERRDDGSPLGTLREWQACALVLDLVPPPSRARARGHPGEGPPQRLEAAGDRLGAGRRGRPRERSRSTPTFALAESRRARRARRTSRCAPDPAAVARTSSPQFAAARPAGRGRREHRPRCGSAR